MAKRPMFCMYAHGVRIRAELVEHGPIAKRPIATCKKCGADINNRFIAFTTQYGFVEDNHWYVFNCAACGVNTAHNYQDELSEAEMIARFENKKE